MDVQMEGLNMDIRFKDMGKERYGVTYRTRNNFARGYIFCQPWERGKKIVTLRKILESMGMTMLGYVKSKKNVVKFPTTPKIPGVQNTPGSMLARYYGKLGDIFPHHDPQKKRLRLSFSRFSHLPFLRDDPVALGRLIFLPLICCTVDPRGFILLIGLAVLSLSLRPS